MTTFVLVLFFSYGHVYNFLEQINLFSQQIGRHRYLVAVWLGLFLVCLWGVTRIGKALKSANKILNLMAGFILIFPLVKIGLFSFRNLVIGSQIRPSEAQFASLEAPIGKPLPDIYYIILDGYVRDDILRKFHQLDNSDFLNRLRKIGFYVAGCAQSNYAQTQLSLASTLNLNYLESLDDRFTSGNTSRVGLPDLIKHSTTRQLLEQLGYKTIAFETGYEATEIRDADLFLSPRIVQGLNDFESLFIRTTAARLLAEGVASLKIKPDWEARDQAHRTRVLYSLEKLREMPQIEGPKFVFAHILSPHWPHVFGPNGEPVHEHRDSASGYRDQVVFINKQIEPVLAEIIANSAIPPIIIIQGDHGSIIESPVRRMSILNAYFLPNGGDQMLYEDISPVNSFRVIFDYYLGGNYDLLEDISYYSIYDEPYETIIVTNNREGCSQR